LNGKQFVDFIFFIVMLQPSPPVVPFPNFDTTPIVVFPQPQPQPQQPVQVIPGTNISLIIIIKSFFLFS